MALASAAPRPLRLPVRGATVADALRTPADDRLLRQVFGEDELQDSSPDLLTIARSYMPHLTTLPYDRLGREPAVLQAEKARCEREMQRLAIENYSAFLHSATMTEAARQEFANIEGLLDRVADVLEPMAHDVIALVASSAPLAERRNALRTVSLQHGMLLEVLEIPQLLDACIRNRLYEESLSLLAHAGSILHATDAKGEDIPALATLRLQIAAQRANLRNALVEQLHGDISRLPECVRTVGYLRRSQCHSETELRDLFVEHRGRFVESSKRHVEQLGNGASGDAVQALKAGADLLRTGVYDFGKQLQALFPAEEEILSAWLCSQILWYTGLLRQHLRVPAAATRRRQMPDGGGERGMGFAIGGQEMAAPRIGAAELCAVRRQCLHAATSLRRLGGYFFPDVQSLFEAYLEHHLTVMLDVAMLTLHAELGRYDWIPSTALTGTAGAASAQGWLHPKALDLTRHRPLAVFTNDLVQVFNELRICNLWALRPRLLPAIEGCLLGAVNVLRASDAAPSAELMRLCTHLATILLPLCQALTEAVFGEGVELDTAAALRAIPQDVPLEPEGEAETAWLGLEGREAEQDAEEKIIREQSDDAPPSLPAEESQEVAEVTAVEPAQEVVAVTAVDESRAAVLVAAARESVEAVVAGSG